MGKDRASGPPEILIAAHLGKMVTLYHPDGSAMVRDQLAGFWHGLDESDLRGGGGSFGNAPIVKTTVTLRTMGTVRLTNAHAVLVEL